MAEEPTIRADWAKLENWPVRRQAPGYPRRFVVPSTIVFGISIALMAVGFGKGPIVFGWSGVGFLVIGFAVVYRLTLGRFRCPECGEMIVLKSYPKPGGFFRFRCSKCNILWLTGIRVGQD